jgi:DNA-binding winged helix-turn-helix (wHTH) protein
LSQACRFGSVLAEAPKSKNAKVTLVYRRTHPFEISMHYKPRRWTAMSRNTDLELALLHENPPLQGANRLSPATADAALEFGRFRVLSRRRQLFADGVPVELGTRAFDLLLVLLEADGLLVSKEELLSRVWPGVVVSEENLKFQIYALRKALGADRDVIRTEVGRGYRFTGVLCANTVTDARQHKTRPKQRYGRTLFPQNCRQSLRCSFSSS